MENESKKCLKQQFAEQMRSFMKKEGLTLAYLNAECGITESKLCQISRGKVDVRLSTAGKIIEAFHKNADEFFAATEKGETAE